MLVKRKHFMSLCVSLLFYDFRWGQFYTVKLKRPKKIVFLLLQITVQDRIKIISWSNWYIGLLIN